jgi:hypothetical protein
VVCPAKACNTGRCDAAHGVCVYTPVEDNKACDDKDACTSGDVCKAGACVGKAIDCSDGTSCTADSCDKVKGCVHTPVADGTACPNTGCGGTATCKAGLCEVQSAPAFCDDGNGCTADACIGNGQCSHTAIKPCSPKLTATWDVNAPGQVSLSGADFQPGEAVSVKLDGVEVGPITAGADGKFTQASTLAAAVTPGAHQALATGQTGSVSAGYQVLLVPLLSLVVASKGDLGTEFIAGEVIRPTLTHLQAQEHLTAAVDATSTDPRFSGSADASGAATLATFDTGALASGAHVFRVLDTSVSHWRTAPAFVVRRPVMQPIPDVPVGEAFIVTVTDLPGGRPLTFVPADPAGTEFLANTVTPDGINPTKAALSIPDNGDVGVWTAKWVDPQAPTRRGSITFHVVHNDNHPAVWKPLAATSLHRGAFMGVGARFLGAFEKVAYTVDSSLWGQDQANGSGVLVGSFTVPASAALGPAILVASGDHGSITNYALRILNDEPWALTSTSPRIGAGGAVAVSGAGGLPDETVTVRILDASGAQVAIKTGIAVDELGHFTTTVTVPLGTKAGTLTASATHLLGGAVQGDPATATFELSAKIAVTPLLAQNGDTLRIDGDGFAASEQVEVKLDGAVVASTTSTAAGMVGLDLLFLNPAALRDHLITATGKAGLLSADGPFQATTLCGGVQVSTISGSGAAGAANGTGGPPDASTTWQTPWGIAVVPTSTPMLLWVTDPGNRSVRQIVAEPGDTGETTVVGTHGNDGNADDSFGDIRGIAVGIDGAGFQQAVIADPLQRCVRRRFRAGPDWYGYFNSCDGAPTDYADHPAAVYLTQLPDITYQFYYGLLDDGLGCVLEYQPQAERTLRRACRPAGSAVKLEAVAADPVNTLFTNNWLASGSSTPEGVMRIEGYLNTGNDDNNPPLKASVFATSAGARPLHASGLTVGGDGFLYVADANSNALYRVSADGKEVLLLAGAQPAGTAFADGGGCVASFAQPRGLAWAETAVGKVLYVADSGNRRVRRVLLPQ